MTSTFHLEIVGLMKEHRFQVAKSIAEGLKQKFSSSFLEPTIRPLFECDWHVYLTNKKKELRGEVWQFSSNLMCFVNGCLLGNEKDLTSWAEKQWKIMSTRPLALYLALANDYYSKHLRSTGHTFVYMDISIQGESVGRLLFELFTELCPKTCKNFQALCTGEVGMSQNDLLLSYKGSMFHRVVPNGWIQGGDISASGKGDGGASIYGPTFEDPFVMEPIQHKTKQCQ